MSGDPRVSENSETEFQVLEMYSPRRCGGSCAVGPRCQIRALEKLKRSGRPTAAGYPFGGQHDNEYVLRGMMWADKRLAVLR